MKRFCDTTWQCSADTIRELKSLDPEILDSHGQSPLHVAATTPHFETLQAMLDVFYGSNQRTSHQERRVYDIDHVNSDRDSALHVCCLDGDAHKVRMMLQRGADLEKRGNNNYTLLHRLVQVCHRPFFFIHHFYVVIASDMTYMYTCLWNSLPRDITSAPTLVVSFGHALNLTLSRSFPL